MVPRYKKGGINLKKTKTDLFHHAISVLDFSGLGSDSIKTKNIDNLRALSHHFYFQMNDFLALLSRTEKHFIDDQNDMIEQINYIKKRNNEATNNNLLSEHINDKRNSDILNTKNFIDSQFDIVGLGVLFRVHAFLEEVLKSSCQYIKGIYNIKTTYKDMEREGRSSQDRISNFEKCVIYINKSPLNTKVDLYTYNLLFDWNTIRNILVHDGGVISEYKAKEYNEKMGLQTFKSQSQQVTYNADFSIKENKVIEKPLKIKLSFPQIVQYILAIDSFLATLFNPNVINSYRQSQKINNTVNELQNEEKFNEVFSTIFKQLKKDENASELSEGLEQNEEYEDYLRESVKMLIGDFISQ